MSLVELLIGLAIGLFIVATAMGLAVGQLREDRMLVQESRLLLSLEAAADLVTHDLRRAGYQGDAGIAIARVGMNAVANPYVDLSWSGPDNKVLLTFSRDDIENHAVDSNEQFGFRLRAGVIEMMVGGADWQAVTDAEALTVTAFSLTPSVMDVPLGSFCEQPCPQTDIHCPHQQIRSFELFIAARSVTNADVTRELKSSVRVRNDVVLGACPA